MDGCIGGCIDGCIDGCMHTLMDACMHAVGIQSASDLVSETLGSNPAFSRGRQLVSFRFENRLPVPEHRN